MKKVMLLILLVLILDKKQSFSQYKICTVTFPKIQPIGSPPPYPTFSDYIVLNDGNNLISSYDNNRLFNDVNYFIFDAGTLLSYLYKHGNKLQYVQFFLTRDLTASHNVTLSVIGVDNNFNHIYIPDGVLTEGLACGSLVYPNSCDVKFYTFESQAVAAYPNPASGISMCTGDKIFPYSRDISIYTNKPYCIYTQKATAISMIQQYASGIGVNDVSSFVFDAASLAKYIYETNGIQDVVVQFGWDDASPTQYKLRIIISGVDANGNHTYLNNNSVLEHCYPCPNECPVESLARKHQSNIGANHLH